MFNELIRHYADTKIRMGIRERSYCELVQGKTSLKVWGFFVLKDDWNLGDERGWSAGNTVQRIDLNKELETD